MTKKRTAKKLDVRKEKVRILADSALGYVAGQAFVRGQFTQPETDDCMSHTLRAC